jgi:DNA relaxase NicK
LQTQVMPWHPIDYGVDWITSTAKTKAARLRMYRLGSSLIREERKNGNEQRVWGMSGYEGLKCGSVQLGERNDSTIIRLGSGVAWEHWQKVYHAGENFSRVDLQVTATMDRSPLSTISSCYQRALRHSKRRRGGPAVSILRSSNGTATVYLGRRQSHRFARIYDKGAESRLDHYKGAVRFELEVKGALCLPLLREISRGPRPMLECASQVVEHFRVRGISLPSLKTDHRALSAPRRRSDHRRRLAWLRQQVSPSVKMLVADGYRPLLLEIFGLQVTTPQRVVTPIHNRRTLAS